VGSHEAGHVDLIINVLKVIGNEECFAVERALAENGNIAIVRRSNAVWDINIHIAVHMYVACKVGGDGSRSVCQ